LMFGCHGTEHLLLSAQQLGKMAAKNNPNRRV
jgi:hypothetical protein